MLDDLLITNTALAPSQIQVMMNSNGVPGSLSAATAVSIAKGATLDLNGAAQTIASLADSGSGGSVVNSSTVFASTLTLSPTGGSTTFSGQILGGGTLGTLGLVMAGGGTQTLSGPNTYTGGTTVSGGVLRLGGAAAIPAASAVTTTGGTLDLNNYNLTVGSLAGNGGAILSAWGSSVLTVNQATGGSTYGGSLANGGGVLSLTKAGSGTLVLAGSSTYGGPTIISGGVLKLRGFIPGLYEGLVSTNNPTFDTTDSIPQTSVQLWARWGDSTTSGGNNVYPAWADNTTWGYAGYFDNPSSQSVTYEFGKNFDDNGYLKIDGITLINDTNWSSHPTATMTLSPGWHTIDLRFGQFGGGVGPIDSSFGGHGMAFSTNAGATWSAFSDPGNGSLLAAQLPGNNLLPVTTALTIAASATLDLSGGSQQVASLGDYSPGIAGSILNSNSGFTSVLTLSPTGGSSTFSGQILGGGTLGAINLVMAGSGTQVLYKANACTYTGGTSVNGGLLLLDFSLSGAPASNILPTNSLALGGGVLGLKGNPGGTSAQSVGTLTVNGGSSGISLAANGASSLSLTAGTLAVNGAGILAVSTGTNTTLNVGNTWLQGSGSSLLIDITGGTLTSSPPTTSGLIGPWVTVRDANGIALGSVSGGHVVSAAGGAVLPASAAGGTTNYWLGSGTSSRNVTASETGNSLSIIPSAAGQALSINSGYRLSLTANVMSFDGTRYAYSINGPGSLGTSAKILTLDTAGSNALTIAAPISSGTGGLLVLGSGTVVLTASNAFSGGATVGSGATLQLSCGTFAAPLFNSGTLFIKGNCGGAVFNNGALLLTASGSQTLSGAISGNGALCQAGSGVASLTGTNTYSGPTTVAAGTLKLGNSAALGISTGVSVAGGAALDINGLDLAPLNQLFTVSGAGVGGGGSIINSNTAAEGWLKNVTLAGNTTIATSNSLVIGSPTDMSGTLNLAGFTLTKSGLGTLKLNGMNMSGGGNIVVNQGALQLVDDYNNSSQQGVSMTGSGTLTINANGTLTTPNWYNPLTVTMPIVLNGGQIGGSWPGPAGSTIASPITLTANSTMNFSGGYGFATFSGVISGTGGLSIYQDGTNPGSPLTFSGSNTYTGLTQITGGTLSLGNPGALAGSTLDYGNYGGVLDFGSQSSAVLGGIRGAQAMTLVNDNSAAVALSVGNNNQNTTYSGVLGGSGSLVKIGSGTLTLSASNTYSGGTWLAGGALKTGNSAALGGGGLTITGGTLDLGGLTALGMASLAGSGGVISDSSTGACTLIIKPPSGCTTSFSGVITNGNGVVSLLLPAGTLYSGAAAGGLVLSGSNSYTGGTTIDDGTLYVTNGVALPNNTSLIVGWGALSSSIP